MSIQIEKQNVNYDEDMTHILSEQEAGPSHLTSFNVITLVTVQDKVRVQCSRSTCIHATSR